MHYFPFIPYTSAMCGRYRRRSDKQRIAEAFELGMGLEEVFFEPEDDIAPGSIQPVVVQHEDGVRTLKKMRWGFKLPDRFLFNARSEGIERAQFWKDSFLERRCLVPADSFFEWQRVATGSKPKYEFEIAGRHPFAMAGLWAPWKNPKTGQWEHTFAILTGEAGPVMQPIHHREPTIIPPRDYAAYLSPAVRPPMHLLGRNEEHLSPHLLAAPGEAQEQIRLF
jgi:putative SOS response-associated peptidase YedK